jgi:L-threonylcarbamoyladenylate synthase
MKTKILKESDESAIKVAIEILKNDGIICFATETVYAISCNASSDIAVAKLYQLKKREEDKPIAVFVSDIKTAKKFLEFNDLEEKISKKFMPGMITMILKQKPNQISKIKPSLLLNKGKKNLGLRIPDHAFCLKLLSEFGGIIAASSANESFKDPAIDFASAKKYFAGKVDLIIDGGICSHKIASTILKIENDKIKIVREGLIGKNQLEKLCKN